MKVKDIMTCYVEMISSDAKLVEAAGKMKSLNVGALPVSEGENVVGIITDRDITIRAIASGRNPMTTVVSEIMTPQVFYCYEEDDIDQAARLMEEKSTHRLLVLSDDNKPVGFVSLGDVAVKAHNEHLAWEILEKISEPAHPHQ